MDIFLQLVVTGLSVGCLYALIALGFTIIFNATEVINIAQGEFVMMGGFVTFWLIDNGIPTWAAIIITVLAVGALGIAIQRGLFQTARKATVLNLVLITVGLSILLSSSALIVWGAEATSYEPFVTGALKVRSVVITWQSLILVVTTLAAMIGLHFLYQRTRLGQAMLATSINKEAASAMGINVKLMIMISFGIAAAFGGLGGVIMTPIVPIYYGIGLSFTLKGFAAGMLGGLGSIKGALLGGLVLGLLESFVTYYISSGYRDVIAMSIIIIILMVRPGGILGSRVVAEEL
jgi:branched-chain amino acid transport system permease protein